MSPNRVPSNQNPTPRPGSPRRTLTPAELERAQTARVHVGRCIPGGVVHVVDRESARASDVPWVTSAKDASSSPVTWSLCGLPIRYPAPGTVTRSVAAAVVSCRKCRPAAGLERTP